MVDVKANAYLYGTCSTLTTEFVMSVHLRHVEHQKQRDWPQPIRRTTVVSAASRLPVPM